MLEGNNLQWKVNQIQRRIRSEREFGEKVMDVGYQATDEHFSWLVVLMSDVHKIISSAPPCMYLAHQLWEQLQQQNHRLHRSHDNHPLTNGLSSVSVQQHH